jgi:hypothetical protein
MMGMHWRTTSLPSRDPRFKPSSRSARLDLTPAADFASLSVDQSKLVREKPRDNRTVLKAHDLITIPAVW